MSTKPIFVATHPRACSTAFERVFMTRRDILECVHEPFGDAFYYGPERLSQRFEGDEETIKKSGFANTTFKDVMDQIDEKAAEGKRPFVKDMAYYWFPTNGTPAKLAPSLLGVYGKGSAKPGTSSAAGETGARGMNGAHASQGANGAKGGPEEGMNGVKGDRPINGVNGTSGHSSTNPTVIPTELLRRFHFTFLIRHPRRAIPSYYRCTVPPLDAVTGFYNFMPSEAGYSELRQLFDYLRAEEMVGPARAGVSNGDAAGDHVSITVVDADDLLDKPEEVIRAFCKEVGIDYTPDMMHWEDSDSQKHAVQAFKKWNGFHNDVIGSTYLKPRSHRVKSITDAEEDEDWRQKFGEEAARVIRNCVDDNVADYEYLKSFAVSV